jgi:hypothetical protein
VLDEAGLDGALAGLAAGAAIFLILILAGGCFGGDIEGVLLDAFDVEDEDVKGMCVNGLPRRILSGGVPRSRMKDEAEVERLRLVGVMVARLSG